jgi:hypothetical protein
MFDQFPVTSRYYRLDTTTLEMPDGTLIRYLQRRFLPPANTLSLLQEHRVVEGERLDHIAAHYLGDPEQFWRICDANNAMNPNNLLEIGKTLRITLPSGVPGFTNA